MNVFPYDFYGISSHRQQCGFFARPKNDHTFDGEPTIEDHTIDGGQYFVFFSNSVYFINCDLINYEQVSKPHCKGVSPTVVTTALQGQACSKIKLVQIGFRFCGSLRLL